MDMSVSDSASISPEISSDASLTSRVLLIPSSKLGELELNPNLNYL